MSIKNTKDYCPICQQITNHQCLFNVTKHSEHDADFHWEQNYETIQCVGCENIQYRNRYSNEDMYRQIDNDYEEPYDESKYYPRNLKKHTLLRNISDIPDKIRIVYIETIEALKNNCYLLAGVGLRAIIEAICLDQKITGKDLAIKINNLVKNKLITESDGKRLHSIRFLGNDSVHQMEVPKKEKLRIALDIAEQLVKNLYLIDIDANQHLDTIISVYEDFKNLVLRRFRINTIKVGDEKTIKEVLKKDFRRIEPSCLQNFVTQLADEIQNNLITAITKGKTENNQQYFIKT